MSGTQQCPPDFRSIESVSEHLDCLSCLAEGPPKSPSFGWTTPAIFQNFAFPPTLSPLLGCLNHPTPDSQGLAETLPLISIKPILTSLTLGQSLTQSIESMTLQQSRSSPTYHLPEHSRDDFLTLLLTLSCSPSNPLLFVLNLYHMYLYF